MRSWLIVLALSLIFVAPVSSQESSDHKSITHKGQKAEQKKGPPEHTSSLIEKRKAATIQNASEQPKADTDEKLEIDRKLAEYTRQLSIYTKELSEDTGNVSTATFWLVIVTGILACIGIWQGRQLQKTVRLTREEFTATHRPRLRLRRIVPELDSATQKKHVSYAIANIGNTPAYTTGGMARLIYRDHAFGLPNLPGSIEDGMNIGEMTIEAGAQRLLFVENDDVLRQFDFSKQFSTSSGKNLYFFGFVRYADDLGIHRETSFCRLFEGDRFIKIENSDYEYED